MVWLILLSSFASCVICFYISLNEAIYTMFCEIDRGTIVSVDDTLFVYEVTRNTSAVIIVLITSATCVIPWARVFPCFIHAMVLMNSTYELRVIFSSTSHH